MAGLNLRVGGFGGVGTTPNAPNYTPPASVTSAAFGPGASVQAPSTATVLAPTNGFGLAFWVGVASIVGLVIIRQSLPG